LLLALAENRRRKAFISVGIRQSASECEWLARDFALASPGATDSKQSSGFHVSLVSAPPDVASSFFPADVIRPPVVGQLFLGDGAWRGRMWGSVCIDGGIEPLHRLFLTGSGMRSIQLLNSERKDEAPNSIRRQNFLEQARWSRTIGALGGKEIWRRLVSLRIGIVGCGRTGSLVAATLARLGVRQITLIDPDLVELHNLGEMDVVTGDDVGQAKAEAIADRLRPQTPRSSAILLPIVAPITVPAAREAAKECDILFCCADNDAARLATAVITTLYHKVLIDIGTGVFFHTNGGDDAEEERARQTTRQIAATRANLSSSAPSLAPRHMGGDVRLILPGDGCLLCVGNLANYQQAVEDLCNHRLPATVGAGWQQQRAGSLRTLNQLAAALGVQMLQDLVAERIAVTTWTRIECDDIGQLAVNYPAVRRQSVQVPCALCAKAGLGDEGLLWS
jgi:molybdopterin/thiamine biosynthesis adenylyltransferase